MRKCDLANFVIAVFILVSCSQPPSTPTPRRKVSVTQYPPLDWKASSQRLWDKDCVKELPESCTELIALGCDETRGTRFYAGGLQPPYGVMECIHEGDRPPNREYFKQPLGMDTRFRSLVVFQDEKFRLFIKKSEFKDIFAPVESAEEAISYAMAMTSLSARFDINPNDGVEYLVDVIEETHAEEIPGGYLVYLFDSDRKMGCDIHLFYAVKVLVTRDGEVNEMERQEIYRSYACFDFGMLTLDEN